KIYRLQCSVMQIMSRHATKRQLVDAQQAIVELRPYSERIDKPLFAQRPGDRIDIVAVSGQLATNSIVTIERPDIRLESVAEHRLRMPVHVDRVGNARVVQVPKELLVRAAYDDIKIVPILGLAEQGGTYGASYHPGVRTRWQARQQGLAPSCQKLSGIIASLARQVIFDERLDEQRWRRRRAPQYVIFLEDLEVPGQDQLVAFQVGSIVDAEAGAICILHVMPGSQELTGRVIDRN